MTAAREHKIRTQQRRMLRWMLGARRIPNPEPIASSSEHSSDTSSNTESEPDPIEDEEADMDQETWIEFLRRTTYIAEDCLNRLGLDDWVIAQRRRKWRWAGHLARRDDERWSTKLLSWRPQEGRRCVGHPKMRWSDVFNLFFVWRDTAAPRGGDWQQLAQDRELWKSLEDEFVSRSW
eukprot:1047595-Karenia_brevis.AAC.1